MHLKLSILLALISIANSDLPSTYSSFNQFQKFRPSQNLDSSAGPYEYTQYSPNDFVLSLKTPNQIYGRPILPPTQNPHGHDINLYPPLPPNQNQKPHGFYNIPAGNPIYQKPLTHTNINIPNLDLPQPQFQKPLFTPAVNTLEYPATHGQMNNYNKALQEETQQQLQNQQQQQYQQQQQQDDGIPNTSFSNGFTGYGIQPAKSYVNVKFGGPPNQNYQYQF